MCDESSFHEIDPGAALTLVVGWKSGTKMRLGQLLLSNEVADHFRAIVASTLDDLAAREAEPWTPEADLSPETYLRLSVDDLGDAPVLAGGVSEQATFAEALNYGEELVRLRPDELPAADLSFYAFVLGDVPGARAVFLRRVNPRRGLKGGKFFTAFADVLKTVEEPIFGFDELIDLVFHDGSVAVLSQTTFVALFRDQQVLTAQVPGWAADLAQHVPISAAGQERLAAKAIRDSRAKARLEAIVRRGHLADVDPDHLKTRMDELGLDSEVLLDANGELLLEDEDVHLVLQFLNEDLFFGALTAEGFRADKKARR